MKQCETCGNDISHRRSNARYCSDECKKARPQNASRSCGVCGKDLSHRPKAKYCAGKCARIADNQKRREWRAIPENHERERLSRNLAQNSRYANDAEYQMERKAASRKYYQENKEIVLAKDKERRERNAENPEWVEKNRARRRTAHYHAVRNARRLIRRANDPALVEQERARGRQRYRDNPQKWWKGRVNHKARYNSDPDYRAVSRDYHRKWKFGLPPGEFKKMVLSQQGLCAICRKDNSGKNLHVDHNHSTGQVRDLLCSPCNTAIGKFSEEIQYILNAVGYLEGQSWKPGEVPKVTEAQLSQMTDISDRGFWSSKDNSLKATYGIDKLQYGWLLKRGEGKCWICRRKEKVSLGRNGGKRAKRSSLLNVDHDHSNGNIRGLLCYNCNTAIGYLKDNVVLLRSAAAYLSQWNNIPAQAKLLAF